MNPFTNYLERLGGNFLVAAMIPSLGLVITCMVVFDPILHISESFQITNGMYPLLGISLLVSIPTIIVGFTLTALNTFILKFFEGYVFFNKIPMLERSHARKAEKLIEEFESIRLEITTLTQKKRKTKADKALLDDLKDKYYTKVSAYDQAYPPPGAGYMPTKFGNALKASEAYSASRYGIDSVEFWPRLWHVIPTSYRQTIDEARNELSFLVNMSALSFVLYLLCLIAILTNVPSLVSPNWDLFLSTSIRYLAAGFLALGSNWFFNRAALFSVGDYGAMIRSAYDLFRLDLLEHFRLRLPKNSNEELHIWNNLSQLFVLGQEAIEYKPLKYELRKGKKE